MIASVIFGYIIPFILLVVSCYLFRKFRDDRVMKWVIIAVEAAEQIYKESGLGKEKFAYVEEWILKKFKISKEELKLFIESAVYKINTEKKKIEAQKN